MQFIPSTRSVVDADGDSQRNPQDIDDSVDAEQRAEPIAADDLQDKQTMKATWRHR